MDDDFGHGQNDGQNAAALAAWVEADLEYLEPIGEPQHVIETEPLPKADGQWWPWDATDYLCVMRAPGFLSTKKFTRLPDGATLVDPYGKGTWHHYSISPAIADLDGLAAILKRLEPLSEHFVVRGEPQRPAPVRREFRDGGTFKCVDRRWLMVDVDKCPGDSVADAIARLPDYFQGVACWYHYSASMGMSPGVVRVHLWYWLDRPVCCFSLREWAKTLGGVIDVTLYEPVHVHYTANPVFIGMDSPIAERSGMIQGRPLLSLPDSVVDLATWEAQQKAEAEKAKPILTGRRTIESATAGSQRERYAMKALDHACDRIRTAGEGGRHLTVIASALAIGELLEHLDESMARRELIAAAMDAFGDERRRREAEKTVDDGFAKGKRAPKDLSHIGLIELPPELNDEINNYLDGLTVRLEDDKMRYIRFCLDTKRPFPMPYHFDPNLICSKILYYPAEEWVETMARELSVEMDMYREQVSSLGELPNNNTPPGAPND